MLDNMSGLAVTGVNHYTISTAGRGCINLDCQTILLSCNLNPLQVSEIFANYILTSVNVSW
jgi:hypothetical protein